MAVSGVMAALPLTSSLMVLIGRPIRRARSAWLIPRSSRMAWRLSPGGTPQSGRQPSRSMAMVVDDLKDDDLVDLTPIDAAGGVKRDGLMIGLEDEPVLPVEM